MSVNALAEQRKKLEDAAFDSDWWVILCLPFPAAVLRLLFLSLYLSTHYSLLHVLIRDFHIHVYQISYSCKYYELHHWIAVWDCESIKEQLSVAFHTVTHANHHWFSPDVQCCEFTRKFPMYSTTVTIARMEKCYMALWLVMKRLPYIYIYLSRRSCTVPDWKGLVGSLKFHTVNMPTTMRFIIMYIAAQTTRKFSSYPTVEMTVRMKMCCVASWSAIKSFLVMIPFIKEVIHSLWLDRVDWQSKISCHSTCWLVWDLLKCTILHKWEGDSRFISL